MTWPSWISWRGLRQHLYVGAAVTILCDLAEAQVWLPVVLLLGLGGWHEWLDSDFTTEAGAPWNGVLDVLAFLLPALLNLLA